jgi:Fe-S-cluster containining protein
VAKAGSTDFSFVIETPDGTIPRMQVSIPGKPIGLSDLVAFMQTVADAIVTLAIKKAGESNEQVTCGPGCGVCCSQLIPLSAPEVFYIIGRLLELPLAERAPILRRFESIERRMDESGLKNRICSLAETDADADNKAVARDYFYLKEPCPFLVAQSCSIHAWRPVVCREFNALSDPAICTDPFVHKVRTVPLFKRPSSVLAHLASRVAGISPALVPMPLLFDWYESNKDLGKRTWPADMLIKKLLDITVEPRTKDKTAQQ